MKLSDYHLHSEFSFDSEEKIETICKTAIERGFSEIAITDHMDIMVNKPCDWQINMDECISSIKKHKEIFAKDLSVKIGVELGQPYVTPKSVKGLQERYNFDFIIGSIHFLKNDEDLGLFNFRSIDVEKFYDEYLDGLIYMAENFDFDVLGHLTYPFRYIFMNIGEYPDVKQYREKFIKLFKILIKRNKGIEINTSGLFHPIKSTLPSEQVIIWYKECGAEILTFGSDSHKSLDLGKGIKEAHLIVKDIGFSHYMTYTNRIFEKNELYK